MRNGDVEKHLKLATQQGEIYDSEIECCGKGWIKCDYLNKCYSY